MNWEAVPVIRGRVATEDDFRAGDAVFYQLASKGVPNIDLPFWARLDMEDSVRERIYVVQCEYVADRDDVVVGFRLENGDAGVCMWADLLPDTL